jgi:23S rRNA (cytosine1962-C5)-methyltransferase
MWIAKDWKDYELLDCGGGEKLERWDRQVLVRPDPQAIWETDKGTRAWRGANGRYSRSSTGGGHWDKGKLPESWQVHYRDLTFQVKPMNFKHTGLFPEQAVNWDFAMDKIRSAGRPIRVLNLFAYTGGATVACAKAGASVCHVDAAKGMVAWAKENARLSGLGEAPIRWIIDDCAKFVEREIRRGKTYDAIIMDPPSYGRGPSGEVWKLEDNLYPFVERTSRCS